MVVGAVYQKIIAFTNELSVLSLSLIATVFTVLFVQGIKRTILTPVIIAYMTPSTEKNMIKPLKNDQYLYVGEFLAELIQWVIFMVVIFIIWWIKSALTKKN
jgi:large-conductance mechanosensitive channel